MYNLKKPKKKNNDSIQHIVLHPVLFVITLLLLTLIRGKRRKQRMNLKSGILATPAAAVVADYLLAIKINFSFYFRSLLVLNIVLCTENSEWEKRKSSAAPPLQRSASLWRRARRSRPRAAPSAFTVTSAALQARHAATAGAAARRRHSPPCRQLRATKLCNIRPY